jgi:pyocin large subunit-like protein
MTARFSVLTPLALSAVLAVAAACDNGPSAVASKQQDAPAAVAETTPRAAASTDADTPLVGGKPMWSANKQYTAEENARRAFERNGADFGAKDVDDFVQKAHAFVEHPPSGTAKLTRANGDVLLYDAKSNVFAVVSKLGAPRTMFKPDNGKTYWDEQKAREEERQSADKTPSRKDADKG